MNLSVKLFAGIVIAGLISHLPIARAISFDSYSQQSLANVSAQSGTSHTSR